MVSSARRMRFLFVRRYLDNGLRRNRTSKEFSVKSITFEKTFQLLRNILRKSKCKTSMLKGISVVFFSFEELFWHRHGCDSDCCQEMAKSVAFHLNLLPSVTSF